MKSDLCKWWDDSRIAAEEAIWQKDRFFVAYAGYVSNLAKANPEIKTVIEVGCGMGHVGNELRNTYPHLDYYGTDGSALMIEKAKGMYPDLKFGVLDIRDIDASVEYDVVCTFAVMKHFHVSEFTPILLKVLSLAKYAVVQFQMRIKGAQSVEDDYFGPEVVHTWIAESVVVEAYKLAKHRILKPYWEHWRDTTEYIADSREVVIISKRNV